MKNAGSLPRIRKEGIAFVVEAGNANNPDVEAIYNRYVAQKDFDLQDTLKAMTLRAERPLRCHPICGLHCFLHSKTYRGVHRGWWSSRGSFALLTDRHQYASPRRFRFDGLFRRTSYAMTAARMAIYRRERAR